MEMVKVKIKWLDSTKNDGLALPSYHSLLAAGMDIQAAVVDTVTLEPGTIAMLPTNLAVAIASGYEIQVRPRSGLAIKHGVTVVNSPGTIDADYRGEIKVGLINLGSKAFTISRGDRIAQLVVAPVCQAILELVDDLSETERGAGGFGHTGL
ncbi:MAG: dUTP diphosphatase [Proteobacteria bacterium]|nr:dUTP diphosphatase [Pseudomonadota bacterium]MBU1639077.1 dUTP diphosphatase [Pseudomonadota bacterium]